MPQVPYHPQASVQPSGQGTPSLGVQASPAAFGGAVGAALEGAGKTLEHSGDEIFRRAMALQELANESEKSEAVAGYEIEAGKLHAAYQSLEGKAAVEGNEKYNKDLNELRLKIRGGMSNDMSRKMYDAQSLNVMGRSIFNGAGHAAMQNKHWALGSMDSEHKATNNYIYQNPNDEKAFQQGLSQDEARIRDREAPIRGWDETQTDNAVAVSRSAIWANRITGLSKTAPAQAEELLRKNRSQLYGPDLDKVENTVRTQLRSTGSRVIDDKINADLLSPDVPGRPEKGLQARIDEGVAEAKRQAPSDDLFPDYVRDRITATWNKHKAVVRDFEFNNMQTVTGAMNGNYGGKVPTTVEELTATDPKVSAAYDALDETKKGAFRKALAKNAKGDLHETPETIKEYLRVRGMAESDPVGFLDVDTSSLNIPMGQRRQLGNLQLEKKKNAESDPRVTRALQALRPTLLEPAGITHAKDADGYNQFVGALQGALDQWQQDAKKTPNYKEVQEIGARLLQQQVTSPGWLWDTKEKVFQLTVPDEAKQIIKTDPSWAEKGIEPTDEMIQRVYVRKRYQELYGGKDKPSKTQDRAP